MHIQVLAGGPPKQDVGLVPPGADLPGMVHVVLRAPC